jgi:hypothetical protein
MKRNCAQGHKWYDEYGFVNCPHENCGLPPVAPVVDHLHGYKPPKDHGCKVVETDSGFAVVCSRR